MPDVFDVTTVVRLDTLATIVDSRRLEKPVIYAAIRVMSLAIGTPLEHVIFH